MTYYLVIYIIFQDIVHNPHKRPEENQGERILKRRTLLQDVVKQADLTPRAAKLYKIAKMLVKKNRYTDAQNVNLRKLLKRTQSVVTSNFIEQYAGLSKTQRMLIEMQLRTARQPCHVSENITI